MSAKGVVMVTSLTVGRTSKASTEQELRRVTADLVYHYPQVPAEQVRSLVQQSADQLRDVKITDFVPILVQHEVTVTLRREL